MKGLDHAAREEAGEDPRAPGRNDRLDHGVPSGVARARERCRSDQGVPPQGYAIDKFGDRPVANIRKGDVQALISELGDVLAPSTIRIRQHVGATSASRTAVDVGVGHLYGATAELAGDSEFDPDDAPARCCARWAAGCQSFGEAVCGGGDDRAARGAVMCAQIGFEVGVPVGGQGCTGTDRLVEDRSVVDALVERCGWSCSGADDHAVFGEPAAL